MRPVTSPDHRNSRSHAKLRVLRASPAITRPHEQVSTPVPEAIAEVVLVARVAAVSVLALLINLIWIFAR